ncbi:hypothetical protein LTR86_002710 [Recurvomyces mirabilis]|nr:hypothetical protein LTR86_002710 [Recurvomyces mirabilis]
MASTPITILIATLGQYVSPSQEMLDRYGGNENIQNMIARSVQQANSSGYKVTTIALDPSDHPDSIERLTEMLKGTSFQGIMVIYGLRADQEYTPLFEKVINTVKDLSLTTRLLFNNGPDDLIETFERGFSIRL